MARIYSKSFAGRSLTFTATNTTGSDMIVWFDDNGFGFTYSKVDGYFLDGGQEVDVFTTAGPVGEPDEAWVDYGNEVIIPLAEAPSVNSRKVPRELTDEEVLDLFAWVGNADQVIDIDAFLDNLEDYPFDPPSDEDEVE